MAKASDRKNRTISIRLSKADLAMVNRAAVLQGRSRTDFVREAAIDAAAGTLREHNLIPMSPDGFAEFLDVLAQPAGAAPQLVKALHHLSPWQSGHD